MTEKIKKTLVDSQAFNEITKIARRDFLKGMSEELKKILPYDILPSLKREAIIKATNLVNKKFNTTVKDLGSYAVLFDIRVKRLVMYPLFEDWVKEQCMENGEEYSEAVKTSAAQHIVFNGITFYERVLVTDFFNFGKVTVGWHKDYPYLIFKKEEIENAKQKKASSKK